MKKSIKILIAMVLLNLFLGGVLLSRSLNSPINALINPKTRLKTYKDLRKLNQMAKMPLTDQLYSIIIRKIPAENDSQHPFYLILWEYRRLRSARGMSFPGETFREPGHIVIAPPLEHPTSTPAPAEYFMSFISHDGSLLDQGRPRPFGGNNIVRKGDVIFDINQDGRVEWVSILNHWQSENTPSVKVIYVTRMSYNAEVIFRVAVFSPSNPARPKGDLANEADWSFQCVDEDGDGMLDLQIGPGKRNSITPKVTFYWNPDTENYESPAGKMSPYFRVLSTSRSWSLGRDGKLIYPFDKIR